MFAWEIFGQAFRKYYEKKLQLFLKLVNTMKKICNYQKELQLFLKLVIKQTSLAAKKFFHLQVGFCLGCCC